VRVEGQRPAPAVQELIIDNSPFTLHNFPMSTSLFPPIPLPQWRSTRDTIRGYAQLLGKIRRDLAPRQKHWWHVSLHATATGLTTTPVPAGSLTFEMLLDLTAHALVITTSQGERIQMDLRGQPLADFCQTTLDALDILGIRPAVDRSQFTDTRPGSYDTAAVSTFWQALAQIDASLKQFRGELRQETSPVQLWPHHFDLAMLWFSGRQVADQDPDNEEYADEQMNFGFSTGDESVPDAYFYVTAYPWPAGLEQSELVSGAYWRQEGWRGAVLPYATVSESATPRETLLTFLRQCQQAGAATMK
jgi:hypothetical protein